MLQQTFLKALKTALKSRGISYKALAEHLDISEASVKRVFAEGTLSLERISLILEWANLSFLDIAQLMDKSGSELKSTLTRDQEELLANNPSLCLFFHQLLFGKSIEQLRADRLYDTESLQRFRTALINAELAKAAAKGEIQLLTARGIRWLPDGPMSKAYGQQLKAEFLAGDFQGETALSSFMTRSLTPASQNVIKGKFRILIEEIDRLAKSDMTLLSEQTQPTTFFIAARPFYFSFKTKLTGPIP